MIHPLADVKSKNIGAGTHIWQFSIVLEGALIGKNCNINCHTFIENNVILGDNVTIKSGVYLWDGISIEDNVFVGPNTTFTNDKYPRSKQYPASFLTIKLEQGCSIGAHSTILGGVTIGAFAIVGAGSVVTKDVPPNAVVKGHPAKISSWVSDMGVKLEEIGEERLRDAQGNIYTVKNNTLRKL